MKSFKLACALLFVMIASNAVTWRTLPDVFINISNNKAYKDVLYMATASGVLFIFSAICLAIALYMTQRSANNVLDLPKALKMRNDIVSHVSKMLTNECKSKDSQRVIALISAGSIESQESLGAIIMRLSEEGFDKDVIEPFHDRLLSSIFNADPLRFFKRPKINRVLYSGWSNESIDQDFIIEFAEAFRKFAIIEFRKCDNISVVTNFANQFAKFLANGKRSASKEDAEYLKTLFPHVQAIVNSIILSGDTMSMKVEELKQFLMITEDALRYL